MATKCCDIIVLGAGPAGIAAARYLSSAKNANANANADADANADIVSFQVLEARARVGGRAHTSDALGGAGHNSHPLDHGARWIHGSCSDNAMIKLVRDDPAILLDHHHRPRPDDDNNEEEEEEVVKYEVCLPWENQAENQAGNEKNKDASTPSVMDGKTPPPFVDSETVLAGPEPMIVRVRSGKANAIPTKTLTKVLTKASSLAVSPDNSSNTSSSLGVVAKDVSNSIARQVAQKVFQETIQSAMKDPHQKLNPSGGSDDNSISDDMLEGASLMEVLLWSSGNDQSQAKLVDKSLEDESRKQALFASLCYDSIIASNTHVLEAMDDTSLFGNEIQQEAFRREVFALFNLEIYTFFESWEGAPIHAISAKYGMEASILPGGNTVLAFGYGGLVQRLAYPLLKNNAIRLEQEVISIETMEDDNQQGPKVVVRYQSTGNENGEIQKIQASACIIALPLGVLRAATTKHDASSNGSIIFNPELPPPLVKSIQSLGIAVRNKIELLFPTRWWPETIGRITLACTHLDQTPTYHPYSTFIVESTSDSQNDDSNDNANPNILVCYVAGEFAKETEQKTNEQIQEECMAVLREADLIAEDQPPIPDPIGLHVTGWLQDQYSRGSWTFYGKGSNPDDVRAFRSNADCQSRGIFFAGEHTCDGSVPGDDMGCVHGAWVSGEMAAEAAMKRIS